MAFIINRITASTFSTYLSSQAASHSEMLPVMLTGYYINNGSWEEVQPDIAEAGMMIGAPVTLTDKNGIVVASTDTGLIGQDKINIPNVTVSIPVIGENNILIGTVYVLHNISHGGTIRLAAKNLKEEISFTVSDTGSGISAEDLPHIFKRFYRTDPARNPSEGRLGLGLPIVKSIS